MPEGFQGYVQIYTGDGKGKTTAALGLALRAAGRGLRTYFGQFLKGRMSGEILAAATLAPLLVIEPFGRRGFVVVTERGAPGGGRSRAERGLAKCREEMLSGRYDIIVLDEVCVAVDLGLIPEARILEFLDGSRPGSKSSSPGAARPPGLIERADLVTEMVERKHYSAKGVRARDGIER